MSNDYLPTSYQKFIHASRYARWLEEEERRESWQETVDRYVENVLIKNSRINPVADYAIIEELREAILSTKVMPSMRGLMTAGPALDRDSTCIYNCSYLPVDSTRSFDEAMYILMCGTGVGYSIEAKYVSQLPIVNEHFEQSETIIKVADSKAGWARGLRELLSLLWSGQIPTWDISAVRPAGAKLKTFGGRASGPGPLVQLFEFCVEMFKHAAGRRLTPIEAHDIMCKIAEVVVVGGVRRSAMISLSDLNDREMASAKFGRWWEDHGQRSLSNNSAVYEQKPSMEIFMEEWNELYRSKSGERGIFSREAAKKIAAKSGRRDASYDFGTNPCCVTGDTWIMTSDGPRQISELKDKPFTAIVNGEKYDATYGSWISGKANVYRLKTKEGWELDLTPEHRILTASGEWVEAQNLAVGSQISLNNHRSFDSWGRQDNYGDGFLLGLFVGDGNFTKSHSKNARWKGQVKVWNSDLGGETVKNEAFEYAKNLPHRSDWSGWTGQAAPYKVMGIGELPTNYGFVNGEKHNIKHLEAESSEFYRGFIKGLFDSDGHVEGYKPSDNHKGLSIRVSQSDKELLASVQRMLLRLGIKSSIYKLRPSATSLLPDGRGGQKSFDTKESWRLIISADNAVRFIERVGFSNSEKAEKCAQAMSWRKKIYSKPFVATVESFEFIGEQEVWDAEVSQVHAFDANGIYAHNSEIILRPFQFCNLSEIVVREDDSVDDLKRKVRLATILGTMQASFTDFKYLRKIWKKNAEEEALLGVSLTGQLGHSVLNGRSGKDALTQLLRELKETAIETNAEWAKKLGINPAAAITCVKPSGTVSQLVLCSSGMHTWHSEYYIRTVRGDNKDPMTEFMKDVGIPHEPDVSKPNDTTVFSFPIKAPKDALTRKDLTAIEHLELWLVYQREWCEHKPSITISVKEDEWLEVGAWVYRHMDEMSGVSFLPHSDHTYRQAPYQQCTQEQYEEALAKMPEAINWGMLSAYEISDTTTSSQELACTGNNGAGCDVVDITSKLDIINV